MILPASCAIKCGDATFPVHRRVLSSQLKNIDFTVESNFYQNGVLNLDGFSPAAVQHFVNYLYSGSLPNDIAFEEVKNLCELADYLGVKGLRDYCQKT
jgi:hypothetical protein